MERSMRVFSKVFVVLLLLVATDPTAVMVAADEPINASNWGGQINFSPIWYWILAALFCMASFGALVVLILIALRVPENDWTTQKVFHCLNFAVNGVMGPMVAKARTCESQSHRFKGASLRKSNCASVCQTKGFHGGKFRGLRRGRFWTKHC